MKDEKHMLAELDDIETKLVDGLLAVRRARLLLTGAKPVRRVRPPKMDEAKVSAEALDKAAKALAARGIS